MLRGHLLLLGCHLHRLGDTLLSLLLSRLGLLALLALLLRLLLRLLLALAWLLRLRCLGLLRWGRSRGLSRCRSLCTGWSWGARLRWLRRALGLWWLRLTLSLLALLLTLARLLALGTGLLLPALLVLGSHLSLLHTLHRLRVHLHVLSGVRAALHLLLLSLLLLLLQGKLLSEKSLGIRMLALYKMC